MKINKFMQDGLDGLEGVEGKGNENKKTEYSGSMFG